MHIDRRLRTGTYIPGLLAETPLRLERIRGAEIQSIAACFVSHGYGERRTAFAQRLRDLLSKPRTWASTVVRDGERPVAVVVHRRDPSIDEIAVLRVIESWPLAGTVARQLLYHRRCDRAREGGGHVRVSEPHVTATVERALTEEAFKRGAAGHFMCTVVSKFMSQTELVEWLGEVEARADLRGAASELSGMDAGRSSELEGALWPLKLADADLNSYLLPIRARYADELLGTDLAAPRLLHREAHLGVAREHVYYRAPRRDVEMPARLVWYVSGDRRQPGAQAVRAVSRLVETVIDEPKRLFERFRHLGVYTRADVEGAAKNGRAMALRFVDTERMASPIPLVRLRQLAKEAGQTLVLESARKLLPTLFADLYQEGMRGPRQP